MSERCRGLLNWEHLFIHKKATQYQNGNNGKDVWGKKGDRKRETSARALDINVTLNSDNGGNDVKKDWV